MKFSLDYHTLQLNTPQNVPFKVAAHTENRNDNPVDENDKPHSLTIHLRGYQIHWKAVCQNAIHTVEVVMTHYHHHEHRPSGSVTRRQARLNGAIPKSCNTTKPTPLARCERGEEISRESPARRRIDRVVGGDWRSPYSLLYTKIPTTWRYY